MNAKVKFSFFDSLIGQCALVWDKEGILRNVLPLDSPSLTKSAVLAKFPEAIPTELNKEMKRVVSKIQLAISGEEADLDFVQVNASNWSSFNKKVYGCAKNIPIGSTTTYGLLAKSMGHPKAFRAVGTALGKNPVPIIVPCHRILGGDGGLRGFSAANGVVTKQMLLRLEGCKGFPYFLDYDPLESSKFLAHADPKLAKLIKLIGPPCISPPRKAQIFESLAKAIISQQLSVKAAQSIYRRVIEGFGLNNGKLDIDRIFRARSQKLRACGLSQNKVQYLKELSRQVRDKCLPSVEELRSMSDIEVVDSLTKIRGIGKWTAEMILIFQLGRSDVLAVDDLALRKGHAVLLGKRNHESRRDELLTYASRWKPYRSAACWYLWRLNQSSLQEDYLSFTH